MAFLCNPLNLPYALQFDGNTAFREAADPSAVFFGGKYYLFLSMNAGYFVTDDFTSFSHRDYPPEISLYDYAPDVCVCGDKLVFCVRHPEGGTAFLSSSDPENLPLAGFRSPVPYSDPCLFRDDDGRLYYYYGCSDRDPIYGVALGDDFQPLSAPVPLIAENRTERGYEYPGDGHLAPETQRPWIEGAWMTKHGGRYYLQYAAPGTQFDVYCDAVFVSSSPLGPFSPAENNPFSYEPAGFLTGAGHGSTFLSPGGKPYHIATARISVNHMFERRIGLWRAGFDRDGELFCDQRFGDFPFDPESEPFAPPEFMLLSYRKKVTASSGTGAENVTDENIRTWWTAAEDDPVPTLTLDLGKEYPVSFVQVNFADNREDLLRAFRQPHGGRYTDRVLRPLRWLLEGSGDGKAFFTLADRRDAAACLPHELSGAREKRLRYLRLTVTGTPFSLPPAVSGLRVFGKGEGKKPEKAILSGIRTAPTAASLSFRSKGEDGFLLLWGHRPDKLYHAMTVWGRNAADIRALTAGQKLFVRADAINENGVTEGDVLEIK
ncbi:MAG: family 43 glycosylhydrolase [Lachnospiraceae bacterium]|nr:family 43 glycosylhydrolase [Lachnospiraceae bacterium]